MFQVIALPVSRCKVQQFFLHQGKEDKILIFWLRNSKTRKKLLFFVNSKLTSKFKVIALHAILFLG